MLPHRKRRSAAASLAAAGVAIAGVAGIGVAIADRASAVPATAEVATVGVATGSAAAPDVASLGAETTGTSARHAPGGQPDARYWRLDDIQAQFDAWELAYPGLFHQTTIGTSGLGEPILLARVSDNASVSEPEPAVLFHGALHANECNGTGAILDQIETLLTGYGVDPKVTARVDGLEIWFVPILNPDGHRYVFSGADSWADWRKTLRDNNGNGTVDFPADGVDLNRNWDWNWQEYEENDPGSQKYKGPAPWSEPEIVAVRDFVLAERPLIVVDYHSPVTITWTNYVFYTWLSQHGLECPDYEVNRQMATDWAAATLTSTGAPFHAIQSYDTLPKEQCWVYGNTGISAFIMEIADQCWYEGATVDSIATRVARGSTYLLDRALHGPGVRGTVTDGNTGAPIVAEVRILEMHSDDVGPRLTDETHGQFYRSTEAGSYTLEVSHPGYTTETVEVEVGSTGWTTADVALQPIASDTGGPTGDAMGNASGNAPWFLASNPAHRGGTVRLRIPPEMPEARADLYGPDGRRVAVLGSELASGREYELTLPTELPGGVSLVRAQSGEQEEVARVVLFE
ncbi:MAG: M14 family zinc carboxypeptidase [Candidatus Eisenbacteria bacterium]